MTSFAVRYEYVSFHLLFLGMSLMGHTVPVGSATQKTNKYSGSSIGRVNSLVAAVLSVKEENFINDCTFEARRILSVRHSACIFPTKSSRKLWVCAEHPKPGSYFLCLIDVHHPECGDRKVIEGWGERRRRGGKTVKPPGVRLTSDSMGGGGGVRECVVVAVVRDKKYTRL